MGPPKSAAYDKDGNLTKAATGFAKGQGVDVSGLSVKETEKGGYICATIEEKGAPALMSCQIYPSCSIPFPKSMRWGMGHKVCAAYHRYLYSTEGHPV
jgi:glycyl-tRNA synthetase beta chain